MLKLENFDSVNEMISELLKQKSSLESMLPLADEDALFKETHPKAVDMQRYHRRLESRDLDYKIQVIAKLLNLIINDGAIPQAWWKSKIVPALTSAPMNFDAIRDIKQATALIDEIVNKLNKVNEK